MMFYRIRNKVIQSLLDMYKFNTEEELKKFFEKYYLLDYDTFIKQIIFEVYYEYYINNTNSVTIASLFDGTDSSLSYDSNYKKVLRAYKKYRMYQDDLSLKFNDGKDVQLKRLSHGKKSFEGHDIYEWQLCQLKNLTSDKYSIFREIQKGTLGDTKRLSNKNLIEYLEIYEDIYDDIQNSKLNFFQKSIQYYQLEIGNRINTVYMIADKVNKMSISSKNKISIMNQSKCFYSIGGLQNKFILGLDNYIDYHTNYILYDNKNRYRVVNEIFILNKNKLILRKYILDWIERENLILDYNEYDCLCKDYFGNRQHICDYKNLDKIIKLFRAFYK